MIRFATEIPLHAALQPRDLLQHARTWLVGSQHHAVTEEDMRWPLDGELVEEVVHGTRVVATQLTEPDGSARVGFRYSYVDKERREWTGELVGHLAGDQVLRCVVDVIQHRIRAQDIVGRYGGEEFLVVLADTSAQGARQLAEQLRAAVQAAQCAHAGESLGVTVSVGVFGGRLEPGDSWDQLIHAADMALYRAKQEGRNRVETVEALGRVTRQGVADSTPETCPSSLV